MGGEIEREGRYLSRMTASQWAVEGAVRVRLAPVRGGEPGDGEGVGDGGRGDGISIDDEVIRFRSDGGE